MLAWLRFGSEAGKLGIGLCLGQGQFGIGNLHNPFAVAMLFILGGLWVMLLAFGLHGLHGLRMWPHMPRFLAVLKVFKRHAQRLPRQQWRLHALACMLAFATSGLIVNLAGLPRGYWLTLTVITTLQMEFQGSLVRPLQVSLASFAAAGLLILFDHSLQSPPMMVMTLLVLVFLSRALQANHYSLFVLQTSLCLVLLAESLAQDWHLAEVRLLNALIGVALSLTIALLAHDLLLKLNRHQDTSRQPL